MKEAIVGARDTAPVEARRHLSDRCLPISSIPASELFCQMMESGTIVSFATAPDGRLICAVPMLREGVDTHALGQAPSIPPVSKTKT